MSMKSDPKYDTDLVNLGYLKKIINELKEINSTTQNNLEKVFSKNYGSQPTTPYYSGSTWTTEDYIYRCIKDRLIGPFSIDDWVIIYDRKKEKLMNENFLFLSQVELKEQSDGYIETYYLVDDPSASWDTSLLKSTHEGDFWRTKTETGFCDYVYTKLATNPVSYDWLITNLPITVFNAVTGTKRIYLVEPNNYSAGDLWQKIENNKKVYYESLKDSETFNSEDWKIINEELSLKNLESYYIITSEINKELETIELNINKKIVESSDSILVAVESDYTKKETTELLTQKVDANGDSIEAIYGDRTIEVPIKSLSELTIGQTEIQTTVGEVSIITSDLEKTIEYFAVELEMYNFNVPTDSEGYVLENSDYAIKHYAYYKGQRVEVTPTLKNTISGFNVIATNSDIKIEIAKGTKIDELNNVLEFSFSFESDNKENILIKKIAISLALQGVGGEQGIPGQTGSDGKTSYLHIKYSNDGLNFTANNGEEIGRWQGTYVDFQETDSLEFSDYKWVDTAIVVNEQINDLNDKIDDTNINLKENYTNNKDLEQKIEDAKTTVITEMQTVITQTKESWEANVIKKINADGVETVKNSLVVIDIKGITVATNISKVSTIMTNNTFAIQNNAGTYLAYFGYDEQEGKSKAEMDNLTIKNYLTTGYHRTEGFVTEEGEKRTGVFYIGG